ncbi:MAG: DUF4957 domain-containing protein, partial [Prevotellaceae bacterium]|nr:DUF4957 domain-containing protein [Prevotellaceae bacterium]
SEFETCTKAHTVWNAPEGESVTSKTFAAVGTCKISAIKVKYSAPSLLPPLASNAYYSWQSPEGTVEEVGGKAVASEADPARVNYPQLKYYTISLNGKKDLSDGKYTTVTLEKPLAEGDTIIVFAFKNKDDDSKKSGVKFFWGAEGTESAMACGDDFPNLYSGGEPALVKYVVPKDAAGKNVFRMTRSETGTNLFIAQLQIVPAGEAPASTSNLGNIIAKAVEGKAQGETAVVTLDATVAYDLKNPVDAGLVNLVVNGNGAIVKLGPTGQIAGMQGIEINNVNFDCDNNTIAPIALSANPDSVLVGSKFQEEGTSLRGGAFYNTGAIVINGCNFSGIHTSWISANKREWNLKTLKIVNTIAQFDVATGVDSYINWVGNSNNEGSIKDIIIEGSTLYNIVESNDNRFLRLQNNSNSQAQKAWAEPQFDAKESWVMTNNTFVNMPSNKEFANNYPNKNNVTFDFKGNIFYNTWRLQKIASSAVRNFTAADNAIIGITNPVDGTDASSYATIDSLLIIGEKPFVVPTTALDLTKEIDLKANFTPADDSYSGINGFGDPRWKVSAPATIYYSQDYEN